MYVNFILEIFFFYFLILLKLHVCIEQLYCTSPATLYRHEGPKQLGEAKLSSLMPTLISRVVTGDQYYNSLKVLDIVHGCMS